MANGLITKNTDLKSLKYSSMPLGSTDPLITKNIGQAPGSQIGAEISHRIDDTSRIAQMLISKPGIKYLLHEAELQQIGVGERIKKAQKGGKSLFGAVLGQLGNTLVTTAKIVGSTLVQVPVNGTGTHFLRAFRTDTYLQPSGGNTASKFAQFFGAGGVEGAPLALQGKPINGVAKETNFGTEKNGIFKIDPKIDTEYGYNSKVYNGKDLKDYDEVKNKPLPTDQYQIARDYAKLGKIIPISSGSVSPKDPLVKSKLQQSKAGNKQIGTVGILEAGASPLLGATTPVYDYSNTATGISAETAILNSQGGKSIKVTPTGSNQRETTLAAGDLKGISNQDVTWDIPENSESNVARKEPYTSTKTYNGQESKSNINSAVNGDTIYFANSVEPTNFAGGILIDTANDPKLIDPKSSNEDGFTRTVQDKYGYGDTYSGDQANRKVDPNKGTTRNVIKEKRVGLGDQGLHAKDKKTTAYWKTPAQDEIDQINNIDVTRKKPDGVGAGRDLAKLFFEIITPNAEPTFLYFRSYIDNIDDSYSADWQSHKYVGRAENFYTYAGFDRDISISFKIAAATRSEMKPLYRKMVYLASVTAPTYGGSDSKFMRGTVAKLSVGSYLDQVPGVITSVKYNLVDGTPWEIAMGQPEKVENDVQVLPMVMQCAVTFKPIHNFAPQTGFYHYFTNASEGVKFFEEGETVV